MTAYRVRITHQVNAKLVNEQLPDYLSPPHSEPDARALIAHRLGRPLNGGPGPWRAPTAGGCWLIELIPDR